MQFSTISHDVDDGVLTVTLDRPDQLNAFTVEMADELEATFVDVNADDDVRAVIVTGAGRAFCAGMDLSVDGNPFGLDESLTPTLADMDDLDDPGLRQVRDTGGRVTLAIYDCRKPVIAAINGAAVGHRRHHDAGDGRPAGVDEGPLRPRVRTARHHARRPRRRGSCPASSACRPHST